MPLRDQSLAELWRASTNLLKWTHKNNRKIYSLLYECVLCVLDELWGVRHFRNQTTPVFMYTADDVDFYVNIMRACVKIIKSLLMKILMGKNRKILCWHWHWYCVPFILIWKSADGSRICDFGVQAPMHGKLKNMHRKFSSSRIQFSIQQNCAIFTSTN